MWYEINVSKNKNHFFATHERSIVTHGKLIAVLKEFQNAFPKEKGFEISVSKMKTTCETFDNDDIERILGES